MPVHLAGQGRGDSTIPVRGEWKTYAGAGGFPIFVCTNLKTPFESCEDS